MVQIGLSSRMVLCLLEKHIDGTGTAPIPPAFSPSGPTPLTADQTAEIKL
jgi:hypothetical protein